MSYLLTFLAGALTLFIILLANNVRTWRSGITASFREIAFGVGHKLVIKVPSKYEYIDTKKFARHVAGHCELLYDLHTPREPKEILGGSAVRSKGRIKLYPEHPEGKKKEKLVKKAKKSSSPGKTVLTSKEQMPNRGEVVTEFDDIFSRTSLSEAQVDFDGGMDLVKVLEKAIASRDKKLEEENE